MKRSTNVKLLKIYHDISHPASYGSVYNLYKFAKKIDKSINLEDITTFLAKENSYTLHKPSLKRFKQRKVLSRHINHIWQLDLLVLSQIKKENDGNRYILAAIDVFSRKAWAIPMKKKDAESTLKALKIIFKKAKTFPLKIHVDKGKEFWNKQVKDFLKTKKIHMYSTENENKASIVERYIRSFKTKLFKYFTASNTLRYIGIVDKLVESLNNRYHRTIGIAPNKVTKKNQKKIYDYQYGSYLKEKGQTPRFNVGDKVRASVKKEVFRKGYLHSYTNEIFTIADVIVSNPPTYRLMDSKGEIIIGTFYEQELVHIL